LAAEVPSDERSYSGAIALSSDAFYDSRKSIWKSPHAKPCSPASMQSAGTAAAFVQDGHHLMPDDSSAAPMGVLQHSVESRASWIAAGVALAILSLAYGSTLLIVVGLRAMELDLGVSRSSLALAGALTWVGTGLGGIFMGWLADRIGVRTSVVIGAVMIACGLALSSLGSMWALYIGQGVLIGLFGMGAVYPPLLIYVSRWFDRRRGTAIALISSGQYIAGVMWPAVFERLIAGPGWRVTYLGFAGVLLLGVVPVAALFLRPAPGVHGAGAKAVRTPAKAQRVLGLRPNVVQAIICVAGFCCCVPMSIPQAHLVAFCGDIGIGAETGAVMLSVLLGCAFISRQLWGAFADRHGGLKTVLAGSALQAVSICAFLLTQNEAGLFVIAAAYGFGFSGIIPAYVIAIRDLFPSAEASWRIPVVLFTAMSGMAFGSWFAGRLYDHFGFYAPAFGSGVLFNILNLMLIGFLILRQSKWRPAVNVPLAA
jgi:MFS family permease